MTGSGKTGLCLSLLEEAANLESVPVAPRKADIAVRRVVLAWRRANGPT